MTLDSKISLRPIEIKDGVSIYNIINRNRVYLRKWLTFIDDTKSSECSIDYIKNTASYKEGGDIIYVILFEGTLIGLIGFESVNKYRKKAELGYWISPEYEGMGIMSYSVGELLRIGFSVLGFNRIEIKCAIGNIRSSAIAKRFNFYFEGLERDGELLSDGSYVDVKVYSLLLREYLECP